MKSSPASARILVATDNADDAHQIVRQIKGEFDNVRVSAVADTAVADFEAAKPDVLVLAFDTLEKCQSYYLGLYRLSADASQSAHRTVVLCQKDEVQAAYELCKKDYFDDYVLYWPQSFDGVRLLMSLWMACRQTSAAASEAPDRAALRLHASHLAELERVVGDGLGLRMGTGVADPIDIWSRALRERLEPALAGTRPLAEAVRQLRPVVMVVDDDAFSRRGVQLALEPKRWEVMLADDGVAALRQLRRKRADVVLMDVNLPGLDGVALTRLLKASADLADIPIVMMTGDARRETALSSMEAGATDFIVKPVTQAALEAKLSKIVPR